MMTGVYVHADCTIRVINSLFIVEFERSMKKWIRPTQYFYVTWTSRVCTWFSRLM